MCYIVNIYEPNKSIFVPPFIFPFCNEYAPNLTILAEDFPKILPTILIEGLRKEKRV